MGSNKNKLAVPNLMQIGADYIGAPAVAGIQAIQKYGNQVNEYVRNIINQQSAQRDVLSQNPSTLTPQQVDEINNTPGFGMQRKKALWDVMQSNP